MAHERDGGPTEGALLLVKRTLALCKSAPSPLVPQHVQESLRKAVQAALAGASR